MKVDPEIYRYPNVDLEDLKIGAMFLDDDGDLLQKTDKECRSDTGGSQITCIRQPDGSLFHLSRYKSVRQVRVKLVLDTDPIE